MEDRAQRNFTGNRLGPAGACWAGSSVPGGYPGTCRRVPGTHPVTCHPVTCRREPGTHQSTLVLACDVSVHPRAQVTTGYAARACVPD
eukprot:3293609-Rhodomonas_salina.1